MSLSEGPARRPKPSRGPSIRTSSQDERRSSFSELHRACRGHRLGIRQQQLGSSGDLPSLISDIHSALVRVAEAASSARRGSETRHSGEGVGFADYIICLEDGKKFKSLKRHLRTQYNMTPEQYREKWGLAPDYPMVAPNSAKARSDLAEEMGLGQRRRKRRARA